MSDAATYYINRLNVAEKRLEAIRKLCVNDGGDFHWSYENLQEQITKIIEEPKDD